MKQQKKFTKGQMFSLDFVIAMTIMVLAIGLLLNYYDVVTNQEKETRIQNELNVVAITASEIMLQNNQCNLDSTLGTPFTFADQGYKLYGCNVTSTFITTTKESLMIPSGFKCFVTLDGARTTALPNIDPSIGGCEAIDDIGAKNVAVIQRNFLAPASAVEKDQYDKCVENGCPAGPFNDQAEHNIAVKVWK